MLVIGENEIRLRFLLLLAVCALWACAGAAHACGSPGLSAAFLLASAAAACALVNRFFAEEQK